uniref:Uncharacterized protein n=1 Tax=Nelumbo nucifera TaxID=4432 RepID=A0A822YJR4_NELNU|nr:TPA_asm: hypothetical protein HUJ06_010622 [Nelumbo nucifera]
MTVGYQSMQGRFPSSFVLLCKDRQMENSVKIVGGQNKEGKSSKVIGNGQGCRSSFIRSFSKACKVAFLCHSFSCARIVGGQNKEGKSSKVAENDRETRRLTFSGDLCPPREFGDAQK